MTKKIPKRMLSTCCATISVLALAACGASASNGTSSGGSSAGSSKKSSSSTTASSGLTSVQASDVAYSGMAATYLGIHKGFFAAHGIKLNIKSGGSPASILSAVVSGQQQIGFTTIPTLITAVSKGIGVRCIASVDGEINPKQSTSAILVRKGSSITKPADLVGKTVAVKALKSELYLLAAVQVADAGGNWKKVHFVQIPFPDMAAALSEKRVDAIVSTAPFVQQAQKQGAKIISYPETQLLPNGSVVCWAASNSYIAAHPKVIKNFQAAQQESLKYTGSHLSEWHSILPSFLDLTPAQAKATPVGDIFTPKLNQTSIKKLEQYMKTVGIIKKAPPMSSLIVPGS